MLLAARAFGAARWLKPCRAVLPLATARLHTSQPLVLGFPSSSRNTRQPRLAAGPPRAAPMSTAADTGAVVVYVTVPNREVGRQIANSLVENKLAACVNIIPGLESIYVWKGEVNRDEELLLMIKSRQALMTELTAHVKGLHPYDECEVISVPITGGSESYLKWVMDSTKDA